MELMIGERGEATYGVKYKRLHCKGIAGMTCVMGKCDLLCKPLRSCREKVAVILAEA